MNERVTIDWEAVRARLATNEALLQGSGEPDPAEMERIFRRRAQQLAAREGKDHQPAEVRPVLIFTLADERFALELDHLAEVFPLERITPVPGSARELLGVVNVRGEIRAAADLARLLGIPRDETAAGTGLLLRGGAYLPALRVDTVAGIHRIPVNEMQPPDNSLVPAGSCIQAILPNRVSLLDLNGLLAHPALR